MEREIYIIGHKNPDTDSICSALAYSNLKNSLEKKLYRAGRAGEINKETEFVLNYFAVEKPILVKNVGCLVVDAMVSDTQTIDQNAPIRAVSRLISKASARFVCVVDHRQHLVGVVTVSDLARRYLEELTMEKFDDIPMPIENIVQTLSGKIIVRNGITEVKGNVLIGAMDPKTMTNYIEQGDILLTGDRENAHLSALEAGIACLIVTGGAMPSPKVQDLAKEKGITVITTPYDTFAAGRLLNMSIPIKQIMSKEVLTFHPGELLSQVKKVMLEKNYRSYPVVNENGHLLGTISHQDFLRAERKRVILVDHNERSQTVDGIDEAELLEIVDHHRLGDIQTGSPIYFRNEPVGCTSTIVAGLYEENDVQISKEMAGIMLAAIISDTLMFRSPTCTAKDKKTAEKLALLAEVEIESFAREMFKAGSDFQDKTAKEIVLQDFKEFSLGEAKVGVGQVSSLDFSLLEEKKTELFAELNGIKESNNYQLAALMLTNIIEESTELIFVGDEKAVEQAYSVETKAGAAYLPGVVSRKKQIVPALAKVF